MANVGELSSEPKCWKLLKYARYMGGAEAEPGKSANDWKVFSSTAEKELVLRMTENNHLLVTYDTQIMENHSLWNGKDYMKAIAKGDSMLITCKLQSVTRRFRMKLENNDKCSDCVRELKRYFPVKAVDVESESVTRRFRMKLENNDKCSDCVRELKRYFPVKAVDVESEKAEGSTSSTEKKEAEGEVTMAALTQALLKTRLPLAYKTTSVPGEQLGTVIKLCLSDSNFPAFVAQVEKELHMVMNE